MEERIKSYNRPPHPAVEFAVALVVLAPLLFIALQSLCASSAFAEVSSSLKAVLGLFGVKIGKLEAPGQVQVVAIAVAISAVFAGLLTASSYSRFHNGAWLGEKPSWNRTYGSSRLESRPFVLRRRFDECDGEDGAPGLIVGSIGSDGDFLLSADVCHALVVGSTGGGKTTSVMLPTIVNLADSGASFVALDPKGELHDVTGRYAEDRGYKRVCIDFSDPARSDGWLPLQPAIDCAKGLNGRDRGELGEEVRTLASVLVPGRSGDSSPIWKNAARILFAGIASFVAESPGVPDDARNLSTVASIAAMDQDRLQRIVEELPDDSPARLPLEQVAFAPEETYGGFRVNLAAEINVYADQAISSMLAKSDFSIEDFLEGKVALYVRFNSTTDAYDPLVAAFVEQTLGGLRRLAERRCGGKLDRPVYWILEEFAQLPRIPGLQKALSVVRSANLHLVLVCQDRSQVEAIYREDAPAIFNNLGTTLFLSANDLKTCKHYSDLLGCYTVEMESRSESKSSNGGGSGRARSFHEARLFRPEDLQKWNYEVGHLVIKDGRAYACGSLPVSKTYAGKALGLDGKEPDSAKRALLAPCRGKKNFGPAKIWHLDDCVGVEGFLAAAIDEAADPRFS